MESIKGELARKLVEACSGEEAKAILIEGIDAGRINLRVEVPTAYSLSPKKERKPRAKKERLIPPNPASPPVPKTRTSLEEKCKNFSLSYPDKWNQAVFNLGLSEPLKNSSEMKFALAEFRRLFKEKK